MAVELKIGKKYRTSMIILGEQEVELLALAGDMAWVKCGTAYWTVAQSALVEIVRFRVGDTVHVNNTNITGRVLAVFNGHAWVDRNGQPTTYFEEQLKKVV